MSRTTECEKSMELRIVRMKLQPQLEYEAMRKGISQTAIARKIILNIPASFQSHLKIPCEPCGTFKDEFRVRGIPANKKAELQSLAKNIGVSVSALVKVEFARELGLFEKL